MKKPPLECAVRKAKVVERRVPSQIAAAGRRLTRTAGCCCAESGRQQSEILVRRPDADRSAISALAWSADGKPLLFGTAGGEAGLLARPPS